ncbi:MAG: type II secretion system protein [Candidatus Hydrogenedentota bacterium]
MIRARAMACGGFTLIEIMVALAVLGTALFVLVEAHYSAFRLFEESREEIIERQLLERVLHEAEVEVMAGEMNGADEFGARYPDYSYSFDAAQVGDERLGLFEVHASLDTPNGDRELSMYVYRVPE